MILANFKDTYKKTTMLNPYRFAKADEPIMSFQTSYSGTFEPIIAPSTGTLKWVVDGVEQITNTPSYALIGNTVNVEVYANSVPQNETVTNVSFSEFGIIGVLSFDWFTINGDFRTRGNVDLTGLSFSNSDNQIDILDINSCGFTTLDLSNVTFNSSIVYYGNSSLTSITFSSSGNVSDNFQGYNCPLLTSLDVSGFVFSGDFEIYSCTSLTSITFSSSGNVSDNFKVYSCPLANLDVSSFTFSNAYFDIRGNLFSTFNIGTNAHTFTAFRAFLMPNLTTIDLSYSTITGALITFTSPNLQTITFSSSGNTSNDVRLYGCNFSSLDFSGFTLSGRLYAYSNSNLSSVNMGSNTHALSDVHLYGCSFSTINFSNSTINGDVLLYSNSSLTSITFSSSGNVSDNFRAYNCNLSSLDLSSFQLTDVLYISGNPLLSSISWGTITTDISIMWIAGCALTLSEVDEIFSLVNTYMSSNPPTSDLEIQVDGGTNASPTGGASNTDIVNLDTVVYPATAYDFTYSIN